MKYFKTLNFIFLSLILCSNLLFAEEAITDSDKDSTLDVDNINVENTTEEKFYWANPHLTQFSKLLPKLSKSLGKLDNRVSRIAVAEFSFDEELDSTFKKVAINKIYGNLLNENPRLHLMKCEECTAIFSEVRGGILHVSRGISTMEDRKRIAKKIGAEGFLRGSITVDKGILTMVVSVYEAERGRIIYSNVFTGNRIPDTTHTNIFIGKMYLPITINSGETVTHEAYMIGKEQTVRFLEDWMFSINSAFYFDNNKNLEVEDNESADTIKLSTGLMLDASLIYDGFSDENKFAGFAPSLGFGQFIHSSQLNYNQYAKAGIRFVIGQTLVINISGYSFWGNKTIEKADSKEGKTAVLLGDSAYSATLGIQW